MTPDPRMLDAFLAAFREDWVKAGAPSPVVVIAMVKELERLRGDLRELRAVVEDQAKRADLWFVAERVTEAYLQATLRQLHEMIERATRWTAAT